MSALVLLLLAASLSSNAAVREVGAIGLTVGDLDRELEFYTKVLPFEKVSESKSIPGALEYLVSDMTGQGLPVAISSKAGTADISMAYICSGPVCGLPVDEPDALFKRLNEVRGSALT